MRLKYNKHMSHIKHLFYFKLEEDFGILYPEKNLKLYVVWPKLSDFINNRVDTKSKNRLDNVFTRGKISNMPHFTV